MAGRARHALQSETLTYLLCTRFLLDGRRRIYRLGCETMALSLAMPSGFSIHTYLQTHITLQLLMHRRVRRGKTQTLTCRPGTGFDPDKILDDFRLYGLGARRKERTIWPSRLWQARGRGFRGTRIIPRLPGKVNPFRSTRVQSVYCVRTGGRPSPCPCPRIIRFFADHVSTFSFGEIGVLGQRRPDDVAVDPTATRDLQSV